MILHVLHVLEADDAQVAGSGDHDVRFSNRFFHSHYWETVHERLQAVDWVDFRDFDSGALSSQGLRASLAHIAIATNQHVLAADQHVGGPVDAVQQGVAGSVAVIELGLGHRIVDVHRWERQYALFSEVVETVHAGGGLLGHATDFLCGSSPQTVVLIQHAPQHSQEGAVLV